MFDIEDKGTVCLYLPLSTIDLTPHRLIGIVANQLLSVSYQVIATHVVNDAKSRSDACSRRAATTTSAPGRPRPATMKTIAENIINHPNEKKYRRFKTTNEKVQQTLILPKGVIEYIRKLGFEPEVEQADWQPYYTFNKRYMSDLKVGLLMINEALERELPKKAREERALEEASAADEAAKEKARKRIMDDRKSVHARIAREATALHTSPAPSSTASNLKKQGAANIKTLADLNQSAPSPGDDA